MKGVCQVNGRTNHVNAWKDIEAREDDAPEHPAGEVTLPKVGGHLTRANALAGYVVGAAMAVQVVPTLSFMSTCCSL